MYVLILGVIRNFVFFFFLNYSAFLIPLLLILPKDVRSFITSSKDDLIVNSYIRTKKQHKCVIL